MSRAAGRMIRSSSRRRTRCSSDRVTVWPSSLVQVLGRGRRALEAMRQAGTSTSSSLACATSTPSRSCGAANTLSSPRREEPTWPCTNRWSPRSTSVLKAASEEWPWLGMALADSMACRVTPAPSWRVTKHRRPVLRRKITRPATPTVDCGSFSSAIWPASSAPKRSRTAAMVVVTGTDTG